MLAQRDPETTILMRDSQCGAKSALAEAFSRGRKALSSYAETCETGNDIRHNSATESQILERCTVRLDIATVRSSRRPVLAAPPCTLPRTQRCRPRHRTISASHSNWHRVPGVPSLTEHLVHPYPRAPPLVHCVHAPPRNEAAL